MNIINQHFGVHLLFGRRGVRNGGERRSCHLPGTGAHVLGGWRDHTGLWAIGQVSGILHEARYSPAMLVSSTQHWSCNQLACVTGTELYGGLAMG